MMAKPILVYYDIESGEFVVEVFENRGAINTFKEVKGDSIMVAATIVGGRILEKD